MEYHQERVITARDDTRADVQANRRLGVDHAGSSCGVLKFVGGLIVADIGGSEAKSE
jgi:hypothetical protein